MTTSEERLRILQMVERGQITAEEGLRLLDALRQRRSREASAGSPRWFRVRVTDLRTGKQKVNVNIPLRLVTMGMKMGARFMPELEGMDLHQVAELAQAGLIGKLVDVENVEEGERVEIFVD